MHLHLASWASLHLSRGAELTEKKRWRKATLKNEGFALKRRKWKCTHYLRTTMLIGGVWVKCLSPQNIFWVSGVNSVAAKVPPSSDVIKQQERNHNMAWRNSVNDAVLSQIWKAGLPDTWMTPHTQYGGLLCVSRLKKGSRLLQLYWIWLQHCLTLRLQKCFVDSNTSPSPPSAQWWVDNEVIFIFWWTILLGWAVLTHLYLETPSS